MFVNGIEQEKGNQHRWLKIIGLCCIPDYIFACLFLIEYLNYGNAKDVFEHWSHYPQKLLLSVIILILFSVVLIFISRKLWISAIIFGFIAVITGLINCIKVAANGDNFVPWDITMTGKISQLVGFAKFNLPVLTVPLIILIVLFCVLFYFSKIELPLRWYFRIPGAVAICIVFTVLYNLPKKTEKIFNVFSMSFDDSILQTSNYTNNGFVNAFTLNCFALKVVAPEGYSKSAVDSVMNAYQNEREMKFDINDMTLNSFSSESKPDVIVILSEAFFDVRTLGGTQFSQNPLENYDEILSRDSTYGGTMYTTAFGGGTVRTEFELLTGLTVDYLVNGTSPYLYVTKDLETYVSNYKSLGYSTTGIHPYMPSFYMRNRAYPLLGFDDFITQEQFSQRSDLAYRRGFITDNTFVNSIIDTLEAKTDTPNFIFGISMENHGAYDKSEPEEIVIDVTNDALSEDILDSVTTYTQGVYNADLALGKLVDYIDSREKDTVLLYFGDHLPTLGAGQGAYNEAGNVDKEDGYSEEERKFLYSTPFLCYANYDNVDYSVFESNHHVSCYYLLSQLAKATGTQMTPYMNYIADNYKELPYYNVRLKMSVEDKDQEFINSMRLITYDRLKGKNYSVTK